MEYGLNISQIANQIAAQAIPQGKTGHNARYDEAATRAISAAISITLREIVSDRGELNRLLKLVDHPIDEGRARAFQDLDYKDQCSVLHRIKTGMRRIKPFEMERLAEQAEAG